MPSDRAILFAAALPLGNSFSVLLASLETGHRPGREGTGPDGVQGDNCTGHDPRCLEVSHARQEGEGGDRGWKKRGRRPFASRSRGIAAVLDTRDSNAIRCHELIGRW